MSVCTYYNWKAEQYQPVKLQLQRHTQLRFCQYLYVFCTIIACSTGPHPPCQCRQVQVQTNCSVHSLGAELCLRPKTPLFYLSTVGRHFLFAPSPYYRSPTLTPAHTNGGLAGGNNNRQLSGKMWMKSVQDSYISVSVTALFLQY